MTRALAIHDDHLVVAFEWCEIWANTAGQIWMRCQCGHKTVNHVQIVARYCKKCDRCMSGSFTPNDLLPYPELHRLIYACRTASAKLLRDRGRKKEVQRARRAGRYVTVGIDLGDQDILDNSVAVEYPYTSEARM